MSRTKRTALPKVQTATNQTASERLRAAAITENINRNAEWAQGAPLAELLFMNHIYMFCDTTRPSGATDGCHIAEVIEGMHKPGA
jgi:hypothetical protein